MAEGFGDAPLSCRYGGGMLKVRVEIKSWSALHWNYSRLLSPYFVVLIINGRENPGRSVTLVAAVLFC